ncbi:glycosyltransferase [Lacinutrix sp. 5H-3-7-4]|uniref:glycosyltransferase n=1 Tax=Lacinutrix sp. (strain 5H-3-7-4) TaxID=983544 RepID=UPI0002115692|nr:glycosyltransferase [Lacinutrix sp. 5H-3-7-4]AEH00886.1 glycosyl transferase group 1 [Lacinutrix sp. 5H-3-7-4]
MRFVFLINRLTMGGAERVVVNLANKLIKNNHAVEIICLEKSDVAYNIDSKCKVHTLTNHEVNNGLLKYLFLIYQAYKLKRYISKNKIKVVQSHLYRANYVNVLSKKLFFSKHISQIINHSSCSRYKNSGIKGKLNLFLIKNLYSKSNVIVAISKMMKFEIEEITKRNDVLVINNPHELDVIKKKMHEEVHEFEFQDNKNYIICIGRLIPLKRNQDIINVIPKLNTNIELLFLGDGEEKEKLINLATDLKVKNRVHFLGTVSNPFKYICKSDFVVSCSETEGFPNVLIEAMVCKTIVISTDCVSGPREIIAPNTNFLDTINYPLNSFTKQDYGILYPVGDYFALKNAIVDVISNNYKTEIEEKAFKQAKKYDIENIILDYKSKLFNLN